MTSVNDDRQAKQLRGRGAGRLGAATRRIADRVERRLSGLVGDVDSLRAADDHDVHLPANDRLIGDVHRPIQVAAKLKQERVANVHGDRLTVVGKRHRLAGYRD